MALAPGSRVGPYEVTALLGEGGMRARATPSRYNSPVSATIDDTGRILAERMVCLRMHRNGHRDWAAARADISRSSGDPGQRIEQRVPEVRERISDCDAAPGEPFLEVL